MLIISCVLSTLLFLVASYKLIEDSARAQIVGSWYLSFINKVKAITKTGKNNLGGLVGSVG